MRNPISSIYRNLLITQEGVVWAVWRLQGVPYGLAPYKAKDAYLRAHIAFARSLHGEALLLGLCASTAPSEIAERMIEGINLETHKQLADETLARLDQLESGAFGDLDEAQRIHYLAVPLSNSGLNALSAPLGAAVDGVKDVLGLPRARPALSNLEARLEQAERIRSSLPSAFGAREASFGDLEFIFARAITRGALTCYAPHETPLSADSTRIAPAAVLPTAVLDEGARTDAIPEGESGWKKIRQVAAYDPMKHRVLKVWGSEAVPSYQCLCAVAGMPAGELGFPGMEWLGNLDHIARGVDWAQRLQIVSNEAAQKANTRVLNELEDQVEQRSAGGSTSARQVGMAELLMSAREYAEEIVSDKNEVEVRVTTIFAMCGPSEETAIQRAEALEAAFKSLEFKLIREPGQQESLWRGMLPGLSSKPVIQSLQETAPAKSWAQAMPLINHGLGDENGMVFAETAGKIAHLDEEATKHLNTSLSVAVCGELGAGKSVTLKTLTLGMLMRNRRAQAVAIDRSHTHEWATALKQDDSFAAIQCGLGAEISLDPLRILPPNEATDIAQTFLTVLLNIHPTSDEGALLAEVLEPKYREEMGLTSLRSVMEHLEVREDRLSRALAKRVATFAKRSSAAAVFNPALPVLDLTLQRIVFLTSSLELPAQDELDNPRRFDQMSIAKIYGRAMYALIMSLVKRVCFADERIPGVFVADEVHALNLSPECSQLLELFIRDSRKHNAWALFGSHDAENDFGGPTQRALIGMRIIQRHSDPDLARKALEWMGFDSDKDDFDELVELVQGFSPKPKPGQEINLQRVGEALIRDFRGQVGVGRILAPASADLYQRVMTTPPPDEERIKNTARKKPKIRAVK